MNLTYSNQKYHDVFSQHTPIFSHRIHGIEAWLLKKAIQALAQEGKAELIASASNEDADCGVKFFWLIHAIQHI